MLSDVSFLTSPLLSAPHGFLKRHGGVSKGIFDSLNCGLSKTDALKELEPKAHIIENRKRAVTAIGGDPAQLCLSTQVHGNVCLKVSRVFEGAPPDADALVTKTQGLVIGVRTADCVPVLFQDPVARVIGVAHAGWKGALAGIIQNTVQAMQSLGAHSSNIRAVLGPAIDQASYEVDEDFFQQFLNQSPDCETLFQPGRTPQKYFFNLTAFVLRKLKGAGIGHLENLGVSTYTNDKDFFSCRRAFHKGEPGFGNQLSLIFMKTST